MGILWHDQALCDPQGHLWEGHPILEASRLTPLMVHLFLSLDCRFCRAEKLLAPMPDAREIQEKLRPTPPTPPCVAGPRGDLTHKEDTEIAASAVGGPALPEDGLEQLKHTSADLVDVIIHILAARHTPAAVPVVPLPDVDV